MQQLIQQVVLGLATGSIYAGLALALVLIYRSTEVVNFAQGEMAMFSTYVTWTLINWEIPFWIALGLAVAIAFLGGVTIERVVIRPVERAPVLSVVIVTLGLFYVFNAAAGWIWGYTGKAFPSPFPLDSWDAGGVAISPRAVGVLLVSLVVLALLWAFFRFTTLGLVMRAAAINPAAARLMGVRVGWMLALGWGLAAAVGAVAGAMAAPITGLDPNMMQGVLLFAFASATLGGFDSPLGAVVGGLFMGVLENLVRTYVGFIGPDMSLTIALGIIILVLLFKPAGLFGRTALKRV